MTLKDIIYAIDKYNKIYPNEYQWICYDFKILDGRPVAYFRYTEPGLLYKHYYIYTHNRSIVCHPSFYGWKERRCVYDYDNIVDAILDLMQWMRKDIGYSRKFNGIPLDGWDFL